MEIEEEPIDVVIPVVTDELHSFMGKKLNEVPGKPFKARPVTISRLPAWIHQTDKELCEPKMVSLGPFHHGKESLRAMEEHKWSTLRDFLARNKNVEFQVYLREMRLLEAQARECYSETVHMGSDDFVMMLLLDGCFILEFFLKLEAGQSSDAALFAEWAQLGIGSDLCLLENQIPFFVIHKLLTIQGRCGENCKGRLCPLLQLIYLVRSVSLDVFHFKPPQILCSEVHHFLHLYYSGVLPDIQLEREQSDSVTGKPFFHGLQFFPWSTVFSKLSGLFSHDKSSTDKTMFGDQINVPCVTELYEAGVKFKRKTKPCDMFDISFRNGILEMPHLMLFGNMKIFLWNMVAFEQSRPAIREKNLSSYFALMNALMNTEKDVAILVRSDIIEHYHQNDEQAAKFFNQSGQISALNYKNHYFHGLFKDVKRYNESTWHKYRARLMHDYFSNPWSAISVVAASILLILTFVQTYYSATK
ncbi:hypothetical protein LUZ62_066591 [Rhynchospora pubera]|uniref:Uncharacterized protein n=1 Tax=Rhynchospora pubera TaxID=906938 RepID=A0AAV8ESN4_9POAL|nr:hypothetical protein LUZ62_066591 [Rhynchospora pubera]